MRKPREMWTASTTEDDILQQPSLIFRCGLVSFPVLKGGLGMRLGVVKRGDQTAHLVHKASSNHGNHTINNNNAWDKSELLADMLTPTLE